MSLFAAKATAARLVGTLSRRLHRGGGTTLPGRILIRMAPDALSRLGAGLPDGAVLVSATNGKTTTAAMAASILAADYPLCRNSAGANLASGIASALVQRPALARLGVFEVDEAALAAVASRLQPRALVLGNLFRDQLDRYGELDLVAAQWSSLIAALDPATAVVVNADDPLLADLASRRDGVTTFGFDDPGQSLPALQHAADSIRCVRCHAAYHYDAVYLGHLGAYRCPQCGHARPPLDLAASDVETDGLNGSRFLLRSQDGCYPVRLAMPGIYNIYNALAAVALSARLGVDLAVAAERLGGFEAAFGRFERLRIGDREAILLLVKNPAGTNEALRTLAASIDGAAVLLALNDRAADGRDVSWIWDVDYETTLPNADRVICAGRRAADIALRVKYAGVAANRVELIPALDEAFDRVLAATDPGRPAIVLPTYTAMLELQHVAAARGLKRPYWEATAA